MNATEALKMVDIFFIKTRDDIIPVYVDLIKANPDQKEVQKLNNFIMIGGQNLL